MTARRASLIFGTTVMCCIFLHLQTFAGEWEVDLSQAQAKAKQLQAPLLLHFSAEWCVPCKKMEATVLHDESLKKKFGSEIVACKIDGTLSPHLLDQYQVLSYPSDVIVSPDGQVLKRSSGVMDLTSYVAMLDTTVSQFRPAKTVPEIKPANPATQANVPIEKEPKLVKGLGGYCPVTLSEQRKWKKGETALSIEFKGITYFLVGERERVLFRDNPRKYAPRLLGCDPVVLTETGRAIPGKTRYGAFFDDQLFLFSTSENRSKFRERPLSFTRYQHALKVDQILRTVKVPNSKSLN